MQYRVGICDSDVNYMMKFMEYINMQERIPLRVSAFSSGKAVDEYALEGRLDMLVLGEGIEIQSQDIPRLYMSSRRGEQGSDKDIYKYQSIEMIAEQIIRSIEQKNRQTISTQEKMIYSVYSPIGRSGKTRLAMGLCEFYKPSLYIGMEEYCGIPPNVQNVSVLSGEQFLYYVVSRNTDIIGALRGFAKGEQGFSIIPACRSYMDLRQLTAEDLEWLKNILLENTDYIRIIFDVGAGVLEDIKILSVTDKIIVPMGQDEVSMIKLNTFKSILKEEAYCELEKKINYVLVPDVAYDSRLMHDTIKGGNM